MRVHYLDSELLAQTCPVREILGNISSNMDIKPFNHVSTTKKYILRILILIKLKFFSLSCILVWCLHYSSLETSPALHNVPPCHACMWGGGGGEIKI